MIGLAKFQPIENTDPNVKIIKVVDPDTGLTRLEQQNLNMNFDKQSIQSGMTYKWSAIGEMTNEELDQLNEKNKKRMDRIE